MASMSATSRLSRSAWRKPARVPVESGESFCQNQTRSRVSTRKVASWLTTRSPQRLAVRTMEKKRTPPAGVM
ncbi:hypothetical protein D3C79_1034370 [compost metagenome]